MSEPNLSDILEAVEKITAPVRQISRATGEIRERTQEIAGASKKLNRQFEGVAGNMERLTTASLRQANEQTIKTASDSNLPFILEAIEKITLPARRISRATREIREHTEEITGTVKKLSRKFDRVARNLELITVASSQQGKGLDQLSRNLNSSGSGAQAPSVVASLLGVLGAITAALAVVLGQYWGEIKKTIEDIKGFVGTTITDIERLITPLNNALTELQPLFRRKHLFAPPALVPIPEQQASEPIPKKVKSTGETIPSPKMDLPVRDIGVSTTSIITTLTKISECVCKPVNPCNAGDRSGSTSGRDLVKRPLREMIKEGLKVFLKEIRIFGKKSPWSAIGVTGLEAAGAFDPIDDLVDWSVDGLFDLGQAFSNWTENLKTHESPFILPNFGPGPNPDPLNLSNKPRGKELKQDLKGLWNWLESRKVHELDRGVFGPGPRGTHFKPQPDQESPKSLAETLESTGKIIPARKGSRVGTSQPQLDSVTHSISRQQDGADKRVAKTGCAEQNASSPDAEISSLKATLDNIAASVKLTKTLAEIPKALAGLPKTLAGLPDTLFNISVALAAIPQALVNLPTALSILGGELGKLASGGIAAMINGLRMLAVAVLTNPLSLLAVAIAVLAAMVYKYWDYIKAFAGGVIDGFMAAAAPIMAAFAPLQPIFDAVGNAIGWLVKKLGEFFAPVDATSEGLGKAAAAGRIFGEVLAAGLQLALLPITLLLEGIGLLMDGIGWVVNNIGKVWNWFKGDEEETPARAISKKAGGAANIGSQSADDEESAAGRFSDRIKQYGELSASDDKPTPATQLANDEETPARQLANRINQSGKLSASDDKHPPPTPLANSVEQTGKIIPFPERGKAGTSQQTNHYKPLQTTQSHASPTTVNAYITVNAAPGMSEKEVAQQIMIQLKARERQAQAQQRGALYDYSEAGAA